MSYPALKSGASNFNGASAILDLRPALRQGEPISQNVDQYARVGHLLGIHKNLRLLFPRNQDYLYGWMKTKNKAFENRTPVEVVRELGFMGLLMVRSYLDRARGV